MFPASCPYVTAVGSTSGGNDGNIHNQIACSARTGQNIKTGGGFSNYYLMPDFQSDVVATYFSLTTPQQSNINPYSTQFRAYPDVSIIGADYGKLPLCLVISCVLFYFNS